MGRIKQVCNERGILMEITTPILLNKWFEKHNTLSKDNYQMFNEIVSLFDTPTETPIPFEEVIKTPIRNNKSKRDKRLHTGLGIKISTQSNVGIYSKVYEEIKKSLLKNPDVDANSIIRKHYPNMKKKSYSKYKWSYLRYLKDNDYRFNSIIKTRNNKRG